MKLFFIALIVSTQLSFAGDLGLFSDGSKSSYRIYQTENQVIVRNGSKATVFYPLAAGDSLYFKDGPGGDYVEIMDANNALLNEGNCTLFLTKKNSCQ